MNVEWTIPEDAILTIPEMDKVAELANKRLQLVWREAEFSGQPPKISTGIVKIIFREIKKIKEVKMDNYTRKYFLGEIERLLESRPVEELKPCLLYLAEDGLPEMLHRSGNKTVGNLLGQIEMEYGYPGESSLEVKALLEEAVIAAVAIAYHGPEELREMVEAATLAEALRRLEADEDERH